MPYMFSLKVRVISLPAAFTEALDSVGDVVSDDAPTLELLTTAGTPPTPVVKVATSLPAASSMTTVSSPAVWSVYVTTTASP